MDILAQGGLAAMRDVKARLIERGIEVDLERCVARQKTDGTLLGDPRANQAPSQQKFGRSLRSGHGRSHAWRRVAGHDQLVPHVQRQRDRRLGRHSQRP